MILRIPASRAFILAMGLVLASAAMASAQEPAQEPAKPEAKFSPTLYIGGGVGVADHESTNFAWDVQVLGRFFRYGALQVQYFDTGTADTHHDAEGLYVGLMPILPLTDQWSLFGQLGGAFSDAGDGVAGGGGVLYLLPIQFLKTNRVDLALQLDYKYLDIADGDHMLTFGLLLGFSKY